MRKPLPLYAVADQNGRLWDRPQQDKKLAESNVRNLKGMAAIGQTFTLYEFVPREVSSVTKKARR